MERLIEVPGPDSESQTQSAARLVAALIVLVSLGWYGAFEVWKPALRIPPRGRELRAEEEKDRNAKFWDGTRAQRVEAYLRSSWRLRGSLVPYWAALMLAAKDSPTKKIMIGKDRWLFLRGPIQPSEAQRERGAALAGHLYGALSRRLASQGIPFVALPVPRKASTCPSKLPDGIDPYPEFEDEIFRSLFEAGVRTVDPRPEWAALAPSDRYQRSDSHWAQGARIELAHLVVRSVPELQDFPRSCWYQDQRLYSPCGNLFPLGIPVFHRIRDVVMDPPEMLVRPRYARGLDRSLGEQLGGDALMIGTSFTAGYDIHTLISVMSQSWVKNKSEAGERALRLLGSELQRRGPGRLPSLVLQEFPVNHVASLHDPDSQGGALDCFRSVPHGALFAPSWMAALEPRVHGAQVGKPRLSFPAGSLTTSGEGVVSVALDIQCDQAASWRIETSGSRWSWTAEPGSQSLVLPVIEDDAPEGRWRLIPTNEGALGAEVNARAVLELSGAEPRALGGERDGRRWTPSEPLLPGRFDRLLAHWSEGAGPSTLTLHVTDLTSGEERVHPIPLGASSSGFFVVDLSPVRGARVDSIGLPESLVDLDLQLLEGLPSVK